MLVEPNAVPKQSRDDIFKNGLIEEIPALCVFGISLCGSIHQSDDPVQDTLLEAWGNPSSFQAATNMRAWLFMFLRNTYNSLYRKRRRELADIDGAFAARTAVAPHQHGVGDLADFRKALATLSKEQREVLVMVGATVAVGTIMSWVNRFCESWELTDEKKSVRIGDTDRFSGGERFL